MKRGVVLVFVLGAALVGCWRHIILVPEEATSDAAYVPDAAIDAPFEASIAPMPDAAPDAEIPVDSAVDSSIDAM